MTVLLTTHYMECADWSADSIPALNLDKTLGFPNI